MGIYNVQNLTIQEFSSSETYEWHDVVYVLGGNEDIYVSVADNNTGNSILNTNYWKPLSGLVDFHEIWVPSYSSSIDFLEDSSEVNFGDGYKQHNSFGLNTNKHNYKLMFKNINDKMAKSLLVFFEYKQGVKPFYYRDNEILKKQKYTCKTWKHVFQQYNRNDVNVVLEEYFGG